MNNKSTSNITNGIYNDNKTNTITKANSKIDNISKYQRIGIGSIRTNHLKSKLKENTEIDLQKNKGSSSLLQNKQIESETDKRQLENKNKYKLSDFHTVAIIGEGGYSIVKLVFDINTGYPYALKQTKKQEFIYPNEYNQKLQLSTGMMLNKEIGIMNSSNSNWIVKLYHYWEDDHFYFLLMEFICGGDLMKHLINMHVFTEDMAKFYIAEIISSLDYLHNENKHVHRDLKPDNIMLDKNGHVKLVDFGLSQTIQKDFSFPPYVSNNQFNQSNPNLKVNDTDNSQKSSSKETSVENIDAIMIIDDNDQAGTPDYMAPEIHRKEQYTANVDLWSVGIILYEMLFGGPPLSDINQNPQLTKQKVVNWKKYFYFPSDYQKYSNEAIDLICKLICEPQIRLKNTKEVMKHPFFKGIDFSNIRKREAPIKPQVKHPLDYSNFDEFSPVTLSRFYSTLGISSSIISNYINNEYIANETYHIDQDFKRKIPNSNNNHIISDNSGVSFVPFTKCFILDNNKTFNPISNIHMFTNNNIIQPRATSANHSNICKSNLNNSFSRKIPTNSGLQFNSSFDKKQGAVNRYHSQPIKSSSNTELLQTKFFQLNENNNKSNTFNTYFNHNIVHSEFVENYNPTSFINTNRNHQSNQLHKSLFSQYSDTSKYNLSNPVFKNRKPSQDKTLNNKNTSVSNLNKNLNIYQNNLASNTNSELLKNKLKQILESPEKQENINLYINTNPKRMNTLKEAILNKNNTIVKKLRDKILVN